MSKRNAAAGNADNIIKPSAAAGGFIFKSMFLVHKTMGKRIGNEGIKNNMLKTTGGVLLSLKNNTEENEENILQEDVYSSPDFRDEKAQK